MREMREAAFRIRGLPVPPVVPPDPPVLLPFDDLALFSWRGAAGASGYDIERAPSAEGPWALLAEQVSDAEVAYRPLFCDGSARAGETWCYRVTARNAGGRSVPSNVVGPVKMRAACFVDECVDLSRAVAHSAGLTLDNTYNARYAEYLFRVCGTTNAWIDYAVPGAAREVRVTAFFAVSQGAPTAPRFLASRDGQSFAEVPHVRAVERAHIAPPHAGDANRQTQVDYVVALPEGTRRVKMVWTRQMALDRVEIEHAGAVR
ncbi:MAG: hypothetical protein BWX70_03312 [Verrucomicrobia bacterium ADurb.Bin070]|nr:MAG: hypothetical protein BWX70_03312 [Verrucomicrobia bacterium ADurb.Bin070]